MSRKDYIAIAEVMRAARDGWWLLDEIAYRLCEVFAEDNELFDKERFLSASGVRT